MSYRGALSSVEKSMCERAGFPSRWLHVKTLSSMAAFWAPEPGYWLPPRAIPVECGRSLLFLVRRFAGPPAVVHAEPEFDSSQGDPFDFKFTGRWVQVGTENGIDLACVVGWRPIVLPEVDNA